MPAGRRPAAPGPVPLPVPVHRVRAAGRWRWLDLRLVPVAATVWLLTLAAPLLSPGLLRGLAGGAAAVAVVLLASRRAGAALVLVGCLAAITVTGAVAGVRSQARDDSPLTGLAARGAVVSVAFALSSDPRPLAGSPERVLVTGRVSEVDGHPTGGARVLLFGPAEEWRGLLPGQSVTVRASLRPAGPIDDVLAVLSARSPPQPVGDAGAVQSAAGTLRAGLSAAADRTLPDPAAGLLPGLVVGDTSGLDEVLIGEFRRSGLSHLLAVSGANVAIAVGLVLAPLRARGSDRRLQALVGVLAIAGFVVLARPEPSVLRAAAMGAVALLALASGRSRVAVPALAASVTLLLLVDPALARDPGFALSVTATAAIVLLAPGWSRRLRRRRLPRPVADAVAVSAAAGLATAPLVAALSGAVSLVSLPANLLAAPVVAPATVLGLLAALVSPVTEPGADALTWLAGWPVRWLVLVARTAAAVPDGATPWPAGRTGALALALLLGAVCWALVRWPRLRGLALAAVLGAVVVGWPLRQAGRGWPLPETVVVACDVGQGDALVFPTGPREGVLVDAGPDAALVDGCLDRLGVDHLPLVLLSHLDADHVGGLAGALTGRAVGEVATGALAPDEDRLPAVLELLGQVGGRHTVLRPGERRTVGGAVFDALAPGPADATAGADANHLSLVVRAEHRGLRVLLTGDIGEEAEARLRRSGADLTADVLKVPHHGSGDVDPDFVAASRARVALISVGAGNSYGHPAQELLAAVTEAGMRVHRTDRDGDVAVVGRAGEWGVAVRGPDTVLRGAATPEPAGPLLTATVPVRRAAARSCRERVAAWPRGCRTPRSDVPVAAGGRRGGAAAGPRRLRGARRGP
ncbi:ComEC/Rec2 family competence protein [Modestobacter sp. SYSU DS0511]